MAIATARLIPGGLPEPVWDQGNLSSHAAKRASKDIGCMENILGITDRTLLPGDLRLKSLQTYRHPKLVYECESFDYKWREFLERRAHFVDRDLVLAITDVKRTAFHTCFHKHPPGCSCPGVPRDDDDSGRQLLNLRQELINKPPTKMRNLRIIPS